MQIIDIVHLPSSSSLAATPKAEPVVANNSLVFSDMLSHETTGTHPPSKEEEHAVATAAEKQPKESEEDSAEPSGETPPNREMGNPSQVSSKKQASSPHTGDIAPAESESPLKSSEAVLVVPPERNNDASLVQLQDEIKASTESLASEVEELLSTKKESPLKVLSQSLQSAGSGEKKSEELVENGLKKPLVLERSEPSPEQKPAVKTASSFDLNADTQGGRKEPDIHLFFPASRGNVSSTQGPALTELSRFFRETVMDQVVRYASVQLREQGSGELRLKLHPQSLGEVRIALQLHNDEVSGRIWVDNSVVKDMFEQNLAQLQQSLAERNLQMNEVSVFVSDHQADSSEEFVAPEAEQAVGESESMGIEYYDIAFENNYVNVLV